MNERRTADAARGARAKMLWKAHLAWLVGRPVATPQGWRWKVLPPGANAHLALTGERISHAQRALNELLRDYHAVLGELTDDAAHLAIAVPRLLELAKHLLHAGGDPPDPLTWLATVYPARVLRRARALARDEGLRPLVEHAAWTMALRPAELARALDAIDHVGPRLLAAGELTSADVPEHLLALVMQDGAERVAPLIDLLASPLPHRQPAHAQDAPAGLLRILGDARPPGPVQAPPATLGKALAASLTQLLEMPGGARRHVYRLLIALDPLDLLTSWASWWEDLDRAARSVRRYLFTPQLQRPRDKEAQLRERVGRLEASAPDAFTGEGLTHLLLHVAGCPAPFVEALLAALAEMRPEPLRFSFVSHWRDLRADAGEKAALIALRSFRGYLVETRALGPVRLACWRAGSSTRAHRFRPVFERTALWREDPATLPVFYQALALSSLAHGGRVPKNEIALLSVLSEGLTDPHLVHQIAANVQGRGFDHADRRPLVAAVRACGERIDLFTSVLDALPGHDAAVLLPALLALAPLARRGEADVALQIAADGHAARLAALQPVFEDEKLEVPWPAVDGSAVPAWASAYPASLHDVLASLASLDPAAEESARRIVAAEVPSDDALQAESAALRERLGGGALGEGTRRRMVTRLANLEARLGRADALPARAVDRCRRKLERAMRARRVAAIEARAAELLRARARRLLGSDDVPSFVLEPSFQRYLLPVRRFEPAMRALAARLLADRAGPEPWGLRAHPANAAFIERMRARGVELQPWLDPAPPREVTTRAGPIELWLERDPLRVLTMGEHFDTCLSPNGSNYFSTFANAADVNKRVLFAADAADPKRSIVGRCLLALTDEGALVAFRPYAHDVALGFADVVASFATQLATRMRIVVVPRGTVPRLVALDWYDDGAHDLGCRFPALEEGSALRAALRALPPKACLAALDAAVGSDAGREVALGLLLGVPEVAERPELRHAVLARLGALPNVSGATALQVAGTALACGAQLEERVSRRLASRLEAHVRELARTAYVFPEPEARVLLRLAGPSTLLRVLRSTRTRGTRQWEDEPHGGRLRLAAEAYQVLGRTAQARRLQALAATR